MREVLKQSAPHLSALVDASPLPFDAAYRSPCWRERPGSALYCLPYLYLAGMPKCSTSTLFVEISKSHPLIAPNCEVGLVAPETRRANLVSVGCQSVSTVARARTLRASGTRSLSGGPATPSNWT